MLNSRQKRKTEIFSILPAPTWAGIIRYDFSGLFYDNIVGTLPEHLAQRPAAVQPVVNGALWSLLPAARESAENLKFMKVIDRQLLVTP